MVKLVAALVLVVGLIAGAFFLGFVTGTTVTPLPPGAALTLGVIPGV